MPQSHVLQFLGGLSLFFFGLLTIQQSLKVFAGDRFKSIIARSTSSRLKSFFTGITVTFFMQSSSAITVMSVALASSGLITLGQAMTISLGAGIGTTIVVLFISLKEIMQHGLVLVILGILIRFLARKKNGQIMGEVILGFGFIFFGMAVMSQSTEPLKQYAVIPQIFTFLQEEPFYAMLIACVMTALLHSSAVVLGVLISLAHAGTISLEAALPLIIGTNVGTSSTAILAAFKSKVEGRRVAWANLLLKAGAVLVLWPFLDWIAAHLTTVFLFIWDTEDISSIAGLGISLTHLLFNVFVALIFLPLLTYGEKMIRWMIPADPSEQKEFGPQYLDESSLETPVLAFAQVKREIVRMGEILLEMLKMSFALFDKYDLEKVEYIQAADHRVDTLYKAIKFYIAHLPFQELKDRDTGTSLYLMTMVNEFEDIGDLIDHNFLRLARRKWNNAVAFSEEGQKELALLHSKTTQTLSMVLAALYAPDDEMMYKIKTHFDTYNELEDQAKIAHLKRLHQGLKESIETSSLHLELLSLFHRINLSLVSIIKPFTEKDKWQRG